MKISKNFVGGNITVKEQNDGTVYLENELRDTNCDWFYWAFCVEDAAGETVTFHLGKNRLGYYGPAVSHDLKEWHWLEQCDETSFTYTFQEDENKVYFAHSMLYHPERFYEFASKNELHIQELCKTKKGRSVPYITIGDGSQSIILTARHHACESTGNYVLEGVLNELLHHPIPDTKIFCVPFVDLDGVTDGDQGKSRIPHDHNRDYPRDGGPSIHPECSAIRDYADKNGCNCAFDFHSPWHRGNENDFVFIVQNDINETEALNHFGELLECHISADSVQYEHKNDYPPCTGWNQPLSNSFAKYMAQRPENKIAFTLETTYFGKKENKITQNKMTELGRCFGKAMQAFLKEEPK